MRRSSSAASVAIEFVHVRPGEELEAIEWISQASVVGQTMSLIGWLRLE